VLPKNLFHARRPAEPHEDPLPGFCLLKEETNQNFYQKFPYSDIF
jgi:hypothetical protein